MRVVGVVGTMVWDTIWRPGARAPVQEWGGISYALAAADAVSSPDIQVRPIVKLGRDLQERGFRFLADLSAVESTEAVAVYDGPNPRVELSYQASQRRCEKISGLLPGWSWPELRSRTEGCDALYINFITGSEMELEVAEAVRENFAGVIYADLHSLMLGTGPGGERNLRPLKRWSEWLACFDAVQMNRDELKMLSSHWGDPWAFAADVVGTDTRLLFVTLGDRGAAYFMTADALPLASRGAASGIDKQARVLTGRVACGQSEEGDPTGCGDVWGITAFCGLLSGKPVEEAMEDANEAAQRNVMHRGASGLSRFLKGGLGRV